MTEPADKIITMTQGEFDDLVERRIARERDKHAGKVRTLVGERTQLLAELAAMRVELEHLRQVRRKIGARLWRHMNE